MNSSILKKALPHVLAILTFLLVAVIFCRPALEGKVLNQHDIVGWKGMAQNAFDYKEKHGHFPLWNTNAFSGMPNYMTAMEGKSILPNINAIMSLGLPEPICFFFLAALCFYILCLSFRLRPIIAVFGGLAFAFATYNPIIIAAGHVTKMYAISYMPLLLAGMILMYEKKYWIGIALTTLGTYLQVGANHPQISYYFFTIATIITIAYLVLWIRNRDWKHISVAFALVAVSAVVALSASSLALLTSMEYAKATIRGGKSISIQGENVTIQKTTGLDTAYAFSYSLGKWEALTMMMPNSFGGSLKEFADENSHVVNKLTQRGVPEPSAVQIASNMRKFWGDPSSTGGGPFYLGVIVCMLALIGFVIYKHPLRWGLLTVCIWGILIALGSNFLSFNLFLFEHLPLYNKFRAPSMAMVIPQFAIPVMAMLTLHLLFFRENAATILKSEFKKIVYALGAVVLLLLFLYISMDYSSVLDQSILSYKWVSSGSDEIGRLIVAGLKSDRQEMFLGQIFRTIGFVLLLVAVLWLFTKNLLKPIYAVVIIMVVSLVDLLMIDKNYLNEDNYISKEEMEYQIATPTAVNKQILADKDPHFRVYNAGNERFSAEDYHYSAFHRSIGGYHAAKLRIYNDIIERYLSGGDPTPILNMLDVKYVVSANPQDGRPTLFTNEDRFGPAWFVKHVKIVSDDVEEIQSLSTVGLRDTAVVQQIFADNISQPVSDSTASIELIYYSNDTIEYKTSSQSTQFAVLSEIYYPFGWNAYIDGNKSDYVKVNYILRGISVPPGQHNIKFVFEPESYKKGVTISYIGSYFIAIFVLGGLVMALKKARENNIA